jgi:hypothetical protein
LGESNGNPPSLDTAVDVFLLLGASVDVGNGTKTPSSGVQALEEYEITYNQTGADSRTGAG